MTNYQVEWKPTASMNNLRLRAQTVADIRAFFAKRGVLEVETPLLSAATVTDPHLHSLSTQCQAPGSKNATTLYLQTSPEFAMKRLLAAGSGAIYQISKAFRNGESGRLHNPEFTLLEWYRPGYDHHELMNEISDLLHQVLGFASAEKISYLEIFHKHLDVDPHTAAPALLKQRAERFGINAVKGMDVDDRNTWLDLLITHIIEPKLGIHKPTFIYDFPASQAALAKIRSDIVPVAERFELYINGIELANGFNELIDAKEQQQRFTADLAKRQQMNLTAVPMDHRLLAALNADMSQCAGVALGIDRLMLILVKANTIAEVLSFDVASA